MHLFKTPSINLEFQVSAQEWVVTFQPNVSFQTSDLTYSKFRFQIGRQNNLLSSFVFGISEEQNFISSSSSLKISVIRNSLLSSVN